jgi:hypothetical protein
VLVSAAPPLTPAKPARVLLKWQDNSTAEAWFFLYRCTPGPACVPTVVAAKVASLTKAAVLGTISYSDTSAVSGTSYCYKVAACNALLQCGPKSAAVKCATAR